MRNPTFFGVGFFMLIGEKKLTRRSEYTSRPRYGWRPFSGRWRAMLEQSDRVYLIGLFFFKVLKLISEEFTK